jgi:thiol-disulfide isomerase/thioredoxin
MDEILRALQDVGTIRIDDNDVGLTSSFEREIDDLTDANPGRSSALLIRERLLEDLDIPTLDPVVVAMLDNLYRGFPPDHSAPATFFPVHVDHLVALRDSLQKALIYIWRENCDPCETMKGHLESEFGNQADDVVLLSAYGPEDPEQLHEEYDIRGAPTLLFVRNGNVDARLLGAHPPSVLTTEFEKSF